MLPTICKACGISTVHLADGLCTECHTKYLTADKPLGLKFDAGKLRYDLVPPYAIKAIADVLTYGADKYAPNSWQTVNDGESRYTAAMMRHFEAYREGEELDPETGKSHLSHCLCNLTFLLWFQQQRLQTPSPKDSNDNTTN